MLNILTQPNNRTAGNPAPTAKKSIRDMLIDSVVVGTLAAVPAYALGSFNFEPVAVTFVLAFFVQLAIERGVRK